MSYLGVPDAVERHPALSAKVSEQRVNVYKIRTVNDLYQAIHHFPSEAKVTPTGEGFAVRW